MQITTPHKFFDTYSSPFPLHYTVNSMPHMKNHVDLSIINLSGANNDKFFGGNRNDAQRLPSYKIELKLGHYHLINVHPASYLRCWTHIYICWPMPSHIFTVCGWQAKTGMKRKDDFDPKRKSGMRQKGYREGEGGRREG